ncbi:hypothetical protein SAMN06296273_2415 [Nitrosomonas ureae]|uniref:Uncharacterized protein n=1 Tax=Nitrosomonas ureae TaxID=44577 RepID=A0A285C0W5_9PROT|nr:hypothetical protein SAMN06296273_2415 [Nitrosomonas ureae]
MKVSLQSVREQQPWMKVPGMISPVLKPRISYSNMQNKTYFYLLRTGHRLAYQRLDSGGYDQLKKV